MHKPIPQFVKEIDAMYGYDARAKLEAILEAVRDRQLPLKYATDVLAEMFEARKDRAY